jgi:integrase
MHRQIAPTFPISPYNQANRNTHEGVGHEPTVSSLRDPVTEKGRVSILPTDNLRTRWLRPQEIERIMANAPGWVQEIIAFAVTTGLRLERICQLRKADYEVDADDNGYVVIARDKNKRKLFKMVEGEIRVLVEGKVRSAGSASSYLFPGPAGKSARMAIKRHLPKAVRKAGLAWGRYRQRLRATKAGKVMRHGRHVADRIRLRWVAERDENGCLIPNPDGVTFHTFRHSMASNALNAGIPEHVVQKMGNWKDQRMLARYAHLADENLRRAESQLAAHLESRVSHTVTPGAEGEEEKENGRAGRRGRSTT